MSKEHSQISIDNLIKGIQYGLQKGMTRVCIIPSGNGQIIPNGDSTKLLAEKLTELNIPFHVAKELDYDYFSRREYGIELNKLKIVY